MLIIYALAIFVSALLLFIVEPMFARMILPLLGGSPSVWNTAVVFYQAMLLLGYVYAHAATRWLGVRRQAALHVVLLLLPLLALPIGIPAGWTPPTQANPALWLLALLLVAVGLPFFVVSASSPLLQTWFAATRHSAAADPYFLYAASNVGSMLALLAYPLLIEPSLGLREQSWMWAGGYVLLAALIGACAMLLRRAPAAAAAMPTDAAPAPAGEPLSVRRRARWVLLAFVPSSLMLSVTTYLSTNIAPIPLLWVIPLAIYLLTFILVFMRRPILPHALMLRALPIVILPLIITLIAQATQPIWLLIGLHLVVFFVAAMVGHGAIARDRPAPAHLTEFYLWISAGGVLGGLFNALLAPLLFTTMIEYPLVLVLACLLQATNNERPTTKDISDRVDVVVGRWSFVLTREALVLYLRKLAPGGVLAFHISNLYLDLKPALGNLAADAGLASLSRDDLVIDAQDQASGKNGSQWAIMGRSAGDLGTPAGDPRWQPLEPRPGTRVWTDDYSSILSAFRWR